MESSASSLAPCARPADPGFDRLNRFLFLVALATWGEAGWRQGAALAAGTTHLPVAVAAALMIASRLAAGAVEALAYALWWRGRGARLPFARFFVALVALSLVDRCTLGLAALAAANPGLAPLLAPLAGPQALGARFDAGAGLRAACGAIGALTLARVVITAWLQSVQAGRRMREALAVTAVAWLGSRVAVWWLVDLARGMSPIR